MARKGTFPLFEKALIRPIKYAGEIWKDYHVEVENCTFVRKYAISNYGRFVSYLEDIFLDGYLVAIKDNGFGYPIVTVHAKRVVFDETKKKERSHVGRKIFIHKALAEMFLKKEHEGQTYVVHLDHDKYNYNLNNLKWASPKESIVHNMTNPVYAEFVRIKRMKGQKLTADRVKIIKKKLAEDKTRMRILAKQFGVSDTVIEHIKYGKYWKHVTIDEPTEPTKASSS